jgi:hypothetical protein
MWQKRLRRLLAHQQLDPVVPLSSINVQDCLPQSGHIPYSALYIPSVGVELGKLHVFGRGFQTRPVRNPRTFG